MSHQVKTLYEVSSEARHVLYKELGVANTVRFFNQFTSGEGNYTEERDATCGGATVDEIADMIRKSVATRHLG